MRFLVLMAEADHFDKWDAADAEQRDRVFADFRAFDAAVSARGAIVSGDALDRPEPARTVRPGAERPVTDGPFAETVEQLGGFYLIDVPDHADRGRGGRRCCRAAYTVEVRAHARGRA